MSQGGLRHPQRNKHIRSESSWSVLTTFSDFNRHGGNGPEHDPGIVHTFADRIGFRCLITMNPSMVAAPR
jgi:hypothetical protein